MDRRLDPVPPRAVPAGFTLVELLVSIAVIAVLSVGAVLATGLGDRAGRDAEAFRQAYLLQRQLAVEGQRLRGLEIGPRAMRPMRREGGAWVPAAPERAWRGRAAFAPMGRVEPGGGPEIVFLPDAGSTAFSVVFGTGRDATRCETDGRTGLTCG